MLYYFPYVNHEVEKLHHLLEFFFNKVEVSCPQTFDIEDLFPVWYLSNTNRLRKLENELRLFVETFDRVTQLNIIRSFNNSNKIEYLFSNKVDSLFNVINIPTAQDHPAYEVYLDSLFVYLYSNQLSAKDSTFVKKIEGKNFYSHYKDLRRAAINQKGTFSICPYCGLEDLKMIESEGRPHYDHLLAKGDFLFVFSAINLKNLTPVGLICNGLKDTTHLLYEDNTRTTRTTAFYPYSSLPDPYNSCIFQLVCLEYPTLRSGGRWQVHVTPQDPTDLVFAEKINTWNRVFNIQDRYAEYISNKGYVLIGHIIDKLSDNDNELSLRNKIQNKIDNDFDLTYPLIAAIEGLIPKRIFYQWVLSDLSFLSDLYNAKKSPISKLSLLPEIDNSDFEY